MGWGGVGSCEGSEEIISPSSSSSSETVPLEADGEDDIST